jgi:nucleotide-binding universal stress UspA family protein
MLKGNLFELEHAKLSRMQNYIETAVYYAKNLSADLLVISHSTAPGFGRWLKGDVAKGVVDRAHPPCSVLVIKS